MARPRRSRGTGERSRRSTVHDSVTTPQPKKKVNRSAAWREARELIWTHRRRLTIGLSLMLVSRVSGFVLPLSTRWLIDDVVIGKRVDLLTNIALAVLAATVIQAITSFALSQILGVAAQRAITDMRKRVQARVMHLPVRYFDSTQTGVLISRIMSDAEGIRNLVGTGLVQLVGGFVGAALGLSLLMWLNWQLTLITIVVLAVFGGGMAYAFRTLRPLFRERGKINAEVTGRLTEALGGIRVVKSYTAEKREEIVFPTPPRSAKRSSSRRVRTGCFGTSPNR
jgi:ABC-type bacteriocin/lantibiotic exporter with double-glycine peptidase domain